MVVTFERQSKARIHEHQKSCRVMPHSHASVATLALGLTAGVSLRLHHLGFPLVWQDGDSGLGLAL